MASSLASLRDKLPSVLKERVRSATHADGGSRAGQGGGIVLYWMRSVLRAHENPALCAAASAANILQLPLVVLLQVSDDYPHSSARRQMFLLEGARATQQELQQRGFKVIVQVDRQQLGSNSPSYLGPLVELASLIVAEEPFCSPWIAGIEDLRRVLGDRSKCGEEHLAQHLWLVDCCSVVPSSLVPANACHRAYTFENASKRLHAERISQPWQDVCETAPRADARVDAIVASAGRPLQLDAEDLSSLLSDTGVDKAVLPVQHTRGGSREGYARWDAWVSAGGLSTYAKRRNESLDWRGVSRMSAYLNTGMVSPLRIAREANAARGAGKAKYLNEFLTWRGLSYAHCFHFPMPSTGPTLACLPSWAQDTLRKHAADARTQPPRIQGSMDLAQGLSEGRSGDVAWDGMQAYLIQTGELHNNARMGWGKAVARWGPSPQGAIDLLVELNNKFALDGHAPPSYAGLLGCLGLFEGPKEERSVLGRVSFKPPKAKYAALRGLAGELCSAPGRTVALSVPHLASTPGCAADKQPPHASSDLEGREAPTNGSEKACPPKQVPIRRWLKRPLEKREVVIDLE